MIILVRKHEILLHDYFRKYMYDECIFTGWFSVGWGKLLNIQAGVGKIVEHTGWGGENC